MEKRLIGKVALVTGSSGVIGPAIVRRLAAEGAVVAATVRLKRRGRLRMKRLHRAGRSGRSRST